MSELAKFSRMSKGSWAGVLALFVEIKTYSFLLPVLFYVSLVGFVLSTTFSVIESRTSKPIWNFFAKEKLKDYFWGGIAALFLLLTIFSGAATWAYKNNASSVADQIYTTVVTLMDEIADNTEQIAQSSQEISQDTSQIAENTTKIAESTSELADNTKNLKKEISADPKKELANKGVAWSVQAYVEQVQLADVENLKLFYEGGFDPYTKLSFRNVYTFTMADPQSGYDINSALGMLGSMPAVAFDIWNSENARTSMKVALEHGYTPKNDAAFLKNFGENLDAMMVANILDEQQAHDALVFLHSLDASILESLQAAHKNVLTSLQNNTYKNYPNSLTQLNLTVTLDSQKGIYEGVQDLYDEKANDKKFANVFQNKVSEYKAKVQKAEKKLAEFKEARRQKKIEFHKKYIQIITELMK